MTARDKLQLARMLHEISLYLQISGEEFYRWRAYERAARTVAATTDDLAALSAAGRLTELEGIGPVIARHLAEWFQTGKLTYHEQVRAPYPESILELMRVPALGPKRIHLIWEALGIADLAALEQAAAGGQLRKVRGIGRRAEQQILSAIAQLRSGGSARLPLRRAEELAEELRATVDATLGVERTALAGELRRFCETVARIDVVAATPAPAFSLDAWERHPSVAKVLHRDDASVVAQLHEAALPAALHAGPPDGFALALHRYTGSERHVDAVARHARLQKLTLAPWSLRRDGAPLPVRDERELYDRLGLPFVPPELREDDALLFAADTGRTEWIDEAQLCGVVHSHSVWSDGKATLEEMARAAQARGLTYLTVTDHSRSASYAGGLEVEELFRQWDEIDDLNARLGGFRLLKGLEADILEDGSLDCPDAVLERLDVVIGSIHVRHKQGVDAMTERVLRAFDHPSLDIWGHPTGRLVLRRDPVPLHLEAVLDKAARNGVALEVNGSPHRLDLSADHVRLALARGVKLVVGADAHSVRELSFLRYGAATARRGGARRADVLNALPAEAFVRALRRNRSRSALSPGAAPAHPP